MLRRVSFLPISALASAAFFVIAVISWFRTAPPADALGWAVVRESTPNVIVTDSYDAQLFRGSLWIGSIRFSVLSPRGFLGDRDERDASTIHPDAFTVRDGMVPQPNVVLGFSRVSGAMADGPLLLLIDGVLIPCWFLALASGVLPAIWIARRIGKPRCFILAISL
ncbi:MAG: hypothetical protein K8U03_03095 [Planctomycetia bacterium]|nr:hypothetical protein [Planctomycetia bacterium]